MIVRIALLLVGLFLLAHGADGLYRTLQGTRPGSPVAPAIETSVGTLALLISFVLAVKAKRRASQAAASNGPVAAEGAEPSPARARIAPASRSHPEFRRLMLVNLPPYAALSALEDAPPLGPQPAVRNALARVLPGITFNDHGLGQFNADDHSILMDLGGEPQVWAATIDVTGEAAPKALRHLITQTGWRAYAPRLGRFITADDLKA
jgi:hypothetical protein